MLRTLACVGLGLALGAIPVPDATAAPSAPPRATEELVLLLHDDAREGLDVALTARGLVRQKTLGRSGRAVLARRTGPALDAPGAARLARSLMSDGLVRAAAPNVLVPLALVPNDPYLAQQWHLGTTAAGFRARNAWDVELGDPSVVLAFIDTGCDLGHPDFGGQYWVNAGETPGNSLDDDGNGYVDDVNGWDFANDDNDPNPEFSVDSTLGLDVGFHGTFGAGLAAAASNNAVGIAGVAWNCRIMPLRVSRQDTGIALSAVTEAFAYACDNGASVINLSLAGTDPVLEAFFQALVLDAVAADAVVVAAAGNAGTDVTTWPAACESVLAVAGTTVTNQRASFSNWGWYVDIAAPGENLVSAISRNYTRDAANDLLFQFLYGWDGVNPYMRNSGTSYACPLVAGTVALVRSKYPGVPAKDVIAHVIATADVVTYDNDIGGRLNAFAALSTYLDVPGLGGGASIAALGRAVPNPLRAGGTSIAFTLPAAGVVELAVFDVRGRRVAPLIAAAYGAGTHRASWDGRDASGARVQPGLYFLAGSLAGAPRSTRVTVLP
jgi:subtilisin family serine protease